MVSNVLKLWLVITTLTLAACSRQEPQAMPFADARLQVVNGLVTTDYPAVVLLSTGCSGSAVSDSTVVTAGHCVRSGLPSVGEVEATAFRAKHWSEGIDLAIVVYPPRTFSHYISVMDRAPATNDAIVIVGFGHTAYPPSGPLDGQKRFGRNQLFGFANWTDIQGTITHRRNNGNYLHYRAPSTITHQAPGTAVMSSNGDSGGPILIDGKVAGVTSDGDHYAGLSRLGTLVDDPAPDNTSMYEYDSNLYSADAIALMETAVSEISANISGLNALKTAFRR